MHKLRGNGLLPPRPPPKFEGYALKLKEAHTSKCFLTKNTEFLLPVRLHAN